MVVDQNTKELSKDSFSEADKLFPRRVGVFDVDISLIDNHAHELDEFFAHFVGVGCRFSYSMRSIRYEAISNLFDLIEPGQIAPYYRIMVTQHLDPDGPTWRTYKAERCAEAPWYC